MTIRLVEVCAVCGGWGRFLAKKCRQCKGSGGTILKLNKETQEAFVKIELSLNEQEKALLNLYQEGFTKQEIARNLDIQIFRVIPMLHSIEKKLNETHIKT